MGVRYFGAAVPRIEDPEFVSMFLDEAWVTAALKHPNVAQVMPTRSRSTCTPSP